MKIIPIQVLEDNYSYILIDDKTKEAAVIDPVEPIKILNVISQTGSKLSRQTTTGCFFLRVILIINSVFTTHHHWDHAGGNIELVGNVSLSCLLGLK